MSVKTTKAKRKAEDSSAAAAYDDSEKGHGKSKKAKREKKR